MTSDFSNVLSISMIRALLKLYMLKSLFKWAWLKKAKHSMLTK